MKRALAEEIAERALTFLAASPPDLHRFLTASGLDAAELLDRRDDKTILAAVLGYLASDESLAKTFSEDEGLKPGDLLRACETLDPHGASPW
jgi:Protein of unknown function (DUF3572)